MVDNLLTEQECDYLIDLFEEDNILRTWRNTHTFIKDINYADEKINPYLNKIMDECKKHFDEDFRYGWSQIVYWTEGAQQGPHLDKAHKKTIITSITYLNDDYEGGETFLLINDDYEGGEPCLLNKFLVKPKKGRTIFFHGMKYYHGVTQIKNGGRYTLPIWYNEK